jgi:hypothetical protein
LKYFEEKYLPMDEIVLPLILEELKNFSTGSSSKISYAYISFTASSKHDPVGEFQNYIL